MNDEEEGVTPVVDGDKITVAALWPEASVMVVPAQQLVPPVGWHAAQSTQTPRLGQSTQTDAFVDRPRTKARTPSPTPSSSATRPAPAARPPRPSIRCEKRAVNNQTSSALRVAHRAHAPIPVGVEDSRRAQSAPTFLRSPPSNMDLPQLSHPRCPPTSPVPPPSVMDLPLPLPPRLDPTYTPNCPVRPPSVVDLPRPPHPDPWYAPTSPGGPPTLSHSPLSAPPTLPLFKRRLPPTKSTRVHCLSPPISPSWPLISSRVPSNSPPSSPPLSPSQFHQLSEAWRAKTRVPEHVYAHPHEVPTAVRSRMHTPLRVPLPPAPLTCPAVQPLRQEFAPSPPACVAPLLPSNQITAAVVPEYLQFLCDAVRNAQQYVPQGNNNAACPGCVPVATQSRPMEQEPRAKDLPELRPDDSSPRSRQRTLRRLVETLSPDEGEYVSRESRMRAMRYEQELENDEERALQCRSWHIQQTKERREEREEMEMVIAELEGQIAHRDRAREKADAGRALNPLCERTRYLLTASHTKRQTFLAWKRYCLLFD
eukprot:GEMP01031860.1.p1 GENE.GEMP01031860.1~~GEMP01031860.1.p1  ORF type:complete len:538 (+),score=139.56 GEMP01031860.1:49-1662(+)